VRIPDEMRRLWYSTKLRPDRKNGLVSFAEPRGLGELNAAVQRLRTSKVYETFWEGMRRVVIPTAAFAVAAVLILGAANMTLLSAMESWGMVCGDPELTTQDGPFRTSSVCHLAANTVEAGAVYRIRVTIPAKNPGEPEPVQEGCRPAIPAQRRGWWDCSIPATPNGIRQDQEAGWTRAMMSAMVPFRRHVSEPWYKLMARIGKKGSDIYALDWRLTQDMGSISGNRGETYEAVLRARRSGPLYLYVNDAAPVVALSSFYATNNRGSANIDVRLIDREEPAS
jgi:hypothetical protein